MFIAQLFVFFLVLATQAPALAQISRSLELSLKPVIRSLSLETALRFPVAHFSTYALMDKSEADEVDLIRLEILKDIMAAEPTTELTQAVRSSAESYLHRIIASGQTSEVGKELYLQSMLYLQEHAAGVELVLPFLKMEKLLEHPRVQKEHRAFLKKIYDETRMRILQRLPELPSIYASLGTPNEELMNYLSLKNELATREILRIIRLRLSCSGSLK